MAQNKLADQARRQSTERHGKGMIRVGDAAEIDVPGGDPTASRVASGRDVLLAAKEQLGADERWLAEERANGRTWAELAAEMGTTPEALRKKPPGPSTASHTDWAWTASDRHEGGEGRRGHRESSA